MEFSYSLSKRFVFLILAMQFLFIHSVSSSSNITNEYLNHNCFVDQGIYNLGSKYKDNLNILLRKVRIDDYSRSGFIHTSKGDAPDFVTVMFQCRGDSDGSKCRTCADTAVSGFRKRCPRNKGGIIWYDQCFLWVSAIERESISIKTDYKNSFSMYNPNNVRGDAKLFAKRVLDLFSELTLRVEKNKPNSMIILYASGEKKLGKNTLYAMVQCINMIMDCKSCLSWSVTKLFESRDIKQGARVVGMNCEVRYELYPFLRS